MANHSSYHEAQLLIDEEIAELTARMQQEAVQLLKTHRNELAPVSKLPDEILLHIFLIFQDATDLHPKHWHQIMHVCRYWRHLAIGSPSLWTRLHILPHALIPLMLERSQSTPLEVGLLSLTPKESITTLATILHKIKHIRVLHFHLMPPNFLEMVDNILAGLDQDWEATLLELLMVDIITSSGPDAGPVKLATDVFRPTRLLRRLSLFGGYFDWGVLPLPNLTHLDLSTASLGEVSGEQFMETLRHMPYLKALKISWEDIDLRQFPPALCPEPIFLPCLQKLQIADGHQAHFESFLSLMMHPKLHQLRVNPSHPVIDVGAFNKSVLSSIGKANFSLLEFLEIQEQDVIISTSPAVFVYDNYDEESSFIHMSIEIDREGLNIDDDGIHIPFEFVADVITIFYVSKIVCTPHGSAIKNVHLLLPPGNNPLMASFLDALPL
ncbi:hypothetical protein D9619_010042 [Psilocybe cf. subviscida]|uniref:F-box domain-containing protein n=1 Tax=Psilocybe cf. subviscida TaxID=2480587 RepID=A0A8H5BM92_9AGAR|nr:hypothetical protein D9619_010042 [Psilocybe cf. subviscida]